VSALIIDPFPVFRRTLRKMIRDRIPRANIVEIDNFDQVCEILYNKSPDVVFLDIAIFPNNCMNNIRTIKRRLPGSVIVVLTTHDSAEHEAASLKSGADYFFSKTDSSISNLINTVDKAFS